MKQSFGGSSSDNLILVNNDQYEDQSEITGSSDEII
jgi:hypothetical protein